MGSSPRMRGTPNRTRCEGRRFGIIPAYAGNTVYGKRLRLVGGDHPRVCGEHLYRVLRANRDRGSSPRMRGTRGGTSFTPWLQGIIPAYAGNTRFQPLRQSFRRDHPRVCGEHFNAVRNATSPPGSSPRMRGTPEVTAGNSRTNGIIPAYAGNTVGFADGGCGVRDHPRVCGEHESRHGVTQLMAGSSPRMRGTLYKYFAITLAPGIIPAYAGNTILVSCRH